MHVRVRLDGANPRRWHVALLTRLSGLPGIEAVSVEAAPGPDGWPVQADLLFRLESLIFRVAPNGSAPVPPADLAAWTDPAAPDLLLDLCGDAVARCPVWRVAYDGGFGETGLLGSLLAGRVPRLDLLEGDTVLVSGRLGSDYRAPSRCRSRTRWCARPRWSPPRCGTDWRAAPRLRPRPRRRRARAPGADPGVPTGAASGPQSRRPPVQAVLSHARTGAPDGGFCAGRISSTWGAIPRGMADPARRRPSLLRRPVPARRRWDDPRLRRGIPARDRQGDHLGRPLRAGRSRRGAHPRAGGAVSPLLPVSCSRGGRRLDGAGEFRGGHGRPLPGDALPRRLGEGSDAPLRRGRERRDAPRTGWPLVALRHRARRPPGAPAGSGATTTRCISGRPRLPGDRMCRIRPIPFWSTPRSRARGPDRRARRAPDPSVQDCAHGYGRALSLARIDRLDQDGFAQTVLGRIEPGPAWPGSCLHTLNAGGGIECIDGSGRGFAPQGAARRLEPHPGPGEPARRRMPVLTSPAPEPASPCARGLVREPRSGTSIRCVSRRRPGPQEPAGAFRVRSRTRDTSPP